MGITKVSENNKYKIVQEGDKYQLYDENGIVMSPGGKPIVTVYESLAGIFLNDISQYGYSSP